MKRKATGNPQGSLSKRPKAASTQDTTDEQVTDYLEQVSELTFGDRKELQSFDDSYVTKTTPDLIKMEAKRIAELTKHRSKSMPVQQSSKIPVSRNRMIALNVKKKASRDPRFDNLSGEFSEYWHKKSYGFLGEIKDQEIEYLKHVKPNEELDKKKKLRALSILTEQQKAAKRHEETQQRKRELRKKEMEAIANGKKAYYFGKGAIKRAELAEKYTTLKATGQLDKYLQKKQRSLAAKQHTLIPERRHPS